MGSQPILAIFPYLKTSEVVCLRGIEFRSSDDLGVLSGETRAHFETLFQMFFLRGDMRIDRMSYAYLPSGPDEAAFREQLRVLSEVQTIVCYFYSAPHPTLGDPFLTQEHSSLFCFSPASVLHSLVFPEHNTVYVGPDGSRPEANERGELEGYEVRLHGELQSWIAPGCRIHPPAYGLWINISQDLFLLCEQLKDSSLHKPLAQLLAAPVERAEIPQAVLTALKWYNRSLSISAAEEIAVINLAVAFESLLELERGPKVTGRFKEAVLTLVGRFPRFDTWLRQFYAARSQIVHEGQSANLMFAARGQSSQPEGPYRSLVSFGRRLFQICLSTRLFGMRSVSATGIFTWLTTNQERCERVCECLAARESSAVDRITSVKDDILGIDRFSFVPEDNLSIITMLSAAKSLAETYLATDPEETSEVLAQVKRLADSGVRTEPEHREALDALRNIKEALPEVIVYGGGPRTARELLIVFISTVWRYWFMYYYHLMRSADEAEQPAPSEGN